jgi:hypothetical protein
MDSLTPYLPRLWIAVFRKGNAERTGGLALYCLAAIGCNRNGNSLNCRTRKRRKEHCNEKKNAGESHASGLVQGTAEHWGTRLGQV